MSTRHKLRWRLVGKLLRWSGYAALLVGELLDPRESQEGGKRATEEQRS